MTQGMIVLAFFILFLLAHLFKFIRFYLVLLEQRTLGFFDVLFLYVRTTFVNLLIPFKIGEVYRVGAIFHMTGRIETSVLTVLVDRFFDTLALLLIILPFEIFIAKEVQFLPLLLLMGLFLLFLIYVGFASAYSYLNRYFIMNKRSERAVRTLSFLKTARDWYEQAGVLIKGRSPLVFIASLLGWGVELLALKVFALGFNMRFDLADFNEYINSIFSAGTSRVGFIYGLTAAVVMLGLLILTIVTGLIRLVTGRKTGEDMK